MSGIYTTYLLIPHLRVHNANALSSPYTIGFPAMTAWLGATHALQRKLNDNGFQVNFLATGIVSHDCDLQTYRGDNDYVSSIVGTANPLDKTGARSAFIEEARCHLDVSLLIEIDEIDDSQQPQFEEMVNHLLLSQMKMAGGDIQSLGGEGAKLYSVEHGDAANIKHLIRQLMPGYALIERRELLKEAMQEGQDIIDGVLDYLAVHHYCEDNESDPEKGIWFRKRKSKPDLPPGWIVPIATGFQGISELGQANNQRDPSPPHRFAESLVTLGEFKMPFHFETLDEMLWAYQYDEQRSLYQCVPYQDVLASSADTVVSDEFS